MACIGLAISVPVGCLSVRRIKGHGDASDVARLGPLKDQLRFGLPKDSTDLHLHGLIAVSAEGPVFGFREPSAELFQRFAGGSLVHSRDAELVDWSHFHIPRRQVVVIVAIFDPAFRESRLPRASPIAVLHPEHNRRTSRGWSNRCQRCSRVCIHSVFPLASVPALFAFSKNFFAAESWRVYRGWDMLAPPPNSLHAVTSAQSWRSSSRAKSASTISRGLPLTIRVSATASVNEDGEQVV